MLNVSFSRSGMYPADLAKFVKWIEANHPGVSNPNDPAAPSELFWVEGPELVLQLNRESIDLLDQLVDEYGTASQSSDFGPT